MDEALRIRYTRDFVEAELNKRAHCLDFFLYLYLGCRSIADAEFEQHTREFKEAVLDPFIISLGGRPFGHQSTELDAKLGAFDCDQLLDDDYHYKEALAVRSGIVSESTVEAQLSHMVAEVKFTEAGSTLLIPSLITSWIQLGKGLSAFRDYWGRIKSALYSFDLLEKLKSHLESTELSFVQLRDYLKRDWNLEQTLFPRLNGLLKIAKQCYDQNRKFRQSNAELINSYPEEAGIRGDIFDFAQLIAVEKDLFADFVAPWPPLALQQVDLRVQKELRGSIYSLIAPDCLSFDSITVQCKTAKVTFQLNQISDMSRKRFQLANSAATLSIIASSVINEKSDEYYRSILRVHIDDLTRSFCSDIDSASICLVTASSDHSALIGANFVPVGYEEDYRTIHPRVVLTENQQEFVLFQGHFHKPQDVSELFRSLVRLSRVTNENLHPIKSVDRLIEYWGSDNRLEASLSELLQSNDAPRIKSMLESLIAELLLTQDYLMIGGIGNRSWSILSRDLIENVLFMLEEAGVQREPTEASPSALVSFIELHLDDRLQEHSVYDAGYRIKFPDDTSCDPKTYAWLPDTEANRTWQQIIGDIRALKQQDKTPEFWRAVDENLKHFAFQHVQELKTGLGREVCERHLIKLIELIYKRIQEKPDATPAYCRLLARVATAVESLGVDFWPRIDKSSGELQPIAAEHALELWNTGRLEFCISENMGAPVFEGEFWRKSDCERFRISIGDDPAAASVDLINLQNPESLMEDPGPLQRIFDQIAAVVLSPQTFAQRIVEWKQLFSEEKLSYGGSAPTWASKFGKTILESVQMQQFDAPIVRWFRVLRKHNILNLYPDFPNIEQNQGDLFWPRNASTYGPKISVDFRNRTTLAIDANEPITFSLMPKFAACTVCMGEEIAESQWAKKLGDWWTKNESKIKAQAKDKNESNRIVVFKRTILSTIAATNDRYLGIERSHTPWKETDFELATNLRTAAQDFVTKPAYRLDTGFDEQIGEAITNCMKTLGYAITPDNWREIKSRNDCLGIKPSEFIFSKDGRQGNHLKSLGLERLDGDTSTVVKPPIVTAYCGPHPRGLTEVESMLAQGLTQHGVEQADEFQVAISELPARTFMLNGGSAEAGFAYRKLLTKIWESGFDVLHHNQSKEDWCREFRLYLTRFIEGLGMQLFPKANQQDLSEGFGLDRFQSYYIIENRGHGLSPKQLSRSRYKIIRPGLKKSNGREVCAKAIVEVQNG